MLGSIPSSRCQTTCVRLGRSANDGRKSSISRTSIPAGGARRDRTDDLLLAKQALSQLSYGPAPTGRSPPSLKLRRAAFVSKGLPAEAAERRRLVGLGRFELPTSRLSSARSNQL